MASKTAPPLIMSGAQRSTLLALTRSASTPVRQVVRARALLLAADGVANNRIAADLAVSATTVRTWRTRFAADGLAQLGRVRPGQGAKPTISPDVVQAIVQTTTHRRPADQPHWTCQAMAKEYGVSAATVYRIWRTHGLKPHLVDADPVTGSPGPADPAETAAPSRYEPDRVTDVVGVFLRPSARAVAVCMDERSRLQAVNRATRDAAFTGRSPEQLTHGGRRNSTQTLFAALEVLIGSLAVPPAGREQSGRRLDEEFLQFVAAVDRAVPVGLTVHLMLDNCVGHHHAEIQRWLDRHGRFRLLFAPTSRSWLPLAENWLRGPAQTAPWGSFNSVPGLIAAIEQAATGTESPAGKRQPVRAAAGFDWTATTASILGRVRGSQHSLQIAVGQ